MAKHDLRKMAEGQECQARIPMHCNGDTRTVVLAHPPSQLQFGGGRGIKAPDYLGAFVCSSCHAVIDGATPTQHGKTLIGLWFWEAHARTLMVINGDA